MMPHPERVFRAVQNSWYPREWQENGAWLSDVPECKEMGRLMLYSWRMIKAVSAQK